MKYLYQFSYHMIVSTFQKPATIFIMSLLFTLFPTLYRSNEASAAQLPAYNLSLIQYDLKSLQPQLNNTGTFSEVLRQDTTLHKPTDYLSKQTNLVLNDMLNSLAQKIRITFHPKVVVKPFFFVQEIKDMLFFVQSRQLKRIQVDQNFQAKTALQPNQISTLKKLKKNKPFALSPYQNRLYGLHLNIRW
ncbi:hypothetical protein CSA56_09070 [candidate division KSB3 bacterium]|uniref:Uncharacterized protein n=1 Tax=candidate division KSB3 bacterium TaxID=2044937 RepID=A0A2G6KEG9_9BACT|nr:MAG: hypothetical protein CSA56_09070 [candidate division KSB3 bacterium]